MMSRPPLSPIDRERLKTLLALTLMFIFGFAISSLRSDDLWRTERAASAGEIARLTDAVQRCEDHHTASIESCEDSLESQRVFNEICLGEWDRLSREAAEAEPHCRCEDICSEPCRWLPFRDTPAETPAPDASRPMVLR